MSNSYNSGYGFDTFGAALLLMILSMQNNQKSSVEACARYEARKEEKMEHRKTVEKSAMKVCKLVQKVSKENAGKCKPKDVAALAVALNQATAAMQMAEAYAESRPM